jgi:hypothetical protein
VAIEAPAPTRTGPITACGHTCRSLARVVWADNGEEEWLESEATGGTGDLVYVNMWHTKYGANACWLHSEDVVRRDG